MLVNSSSICTPGYINHEGEVVQDLTDHHNTVVTHRRNTRQRHLSSGQDENIASAYFASQYGAQQQTQQRQGERSSKTGSKQPSGHSSRRNSMGMNQLPCNNQTVSQVMANAAALIAVKKQKEKEVAMKKEADHRRQMQQREMTPDNLKIIEQKLLEFQKQQSEGPEVFSCQESAEETHLHHHQSSESYQEETVQDQMQLIQQHMVHQQQTIVQQQQQLEQQQHMIQQQQIFQQHHQQRSESFHQQEVAMSQEHQTTVQPPVVRDDARPYRTNQIGEPADNKRSQSVAATPDREVKRKWSISASTDYLNKTNKDNYMVRSNPIGLVEPSMKRDGYAVGSREGSVYRSSGNINVTKGSRAGSEVRDQQPTGWQAGRRASTSDIKGSGIRSGGNMVEPSVKSQNFCMPFGSAKTGGGFVKKKTKTVNQSAQQITESKLQSKRERNRTISGESSTKVTTTSSEHHQKTKMTRTETENSYQIGSALSGLTSALQQIEVTENKQHVTMALPRKGRRAQSLPRGQISSEESSFRVSLPGSARTSRQASVEPEQRKALSRHGSVEIFDGAYNLRVPNKLSRHSSTSKLEEIHSDHIKIVGEMEDNQQSEEVKETVITETQPTIGVAVTNESSSQQSHNKEEMEVSNQSTCVKKTNVENSFSSTSTSSQRSEMHQSLTSCEHTSYEETKQTNFQSQSTLSQSQAQKNETIVSGQKFNISNGLNRSRHVSSNVEAVGSALKGLDVALEQIAAQQKKGETHYVAKVSSRQSSKRGSISVTNDNSEVTNVRVSLPPSKTNSRATSRRNSVDLSGKGRRSRRGSLDIYTAEYALKIGNKKNITNMQQKNSFHMKVDNKDDSDMNLCGRCHLPSCKTSECQEYGDLHCPRCLAWEHWEDSCPHVDTVCSLCQYIGHTEDVHTAQDFAQRRACVDALGWEPFQDWFYNNEFRSWWQVMGCVGVPLYKIYPRKTQWRTEKPERTEEDSSQLSRTDSVDDMIAQVLKQRQNRPPVTEVDSGRSTPEHLKDINVNVPSDEEIEDDKEPKLQKKRRTFSETLKMLDDDILAELDVKK